MCIFKKLFLKFCISIALVVNLNLSLINASEVFGEMDVKGGVAKYKIWPTPKKPHAKDRFKRIDAPATPFEPSTAAKDLVVPVSGWVLHDTTLSDKFYRVYGAKEHMIETRRGIIPKKYNRTLLTMTDNVAQELFKEEHNTELLSKTLNTARDLALDPKKAIKESASSTAPCLGHLVDINAGHITTSHDEEHITITYEIIAFERDVSLQKKELLIPPNITLIHGVGKHKEQATTKPTKKRKYIMTTCNHQTDNLELN